MRLCARERHEARIEALDLDVAFERGEEIRTEISCKFTAQRSSASTRDAGLELVGWYTDRDGLFALSLAAPDGAGCSLTAPVDPRAAPGVARGAARGRVRLPRAAGARRRRARPYVVANMVTTADGAGGARRPHQGALERRRPRALPRLREQVDAVMVGPRDDRIESYGPLVRDPERRERRRAARAGAGAARRTASRSLELPVDAPLFADPESPIVVLTNSDRRGAPRSPASSSSARQARRSTCRSAMATLRERHGVRALLLEGGPTLLAAMIEARLVDELFLSLAPRAGGRGRASRPSSRDPSAIRSA